MDVSHKEHEATLLESSQDLAGSPRPVAALPFSVPHDPVVNRSGWPRTVVIITAEVMGAGVLGLPFAFARLGWVLGLAACLFFAAAAVYTGLLLARVRGSLYPSASSYGEVAELAVGPRFGAFTRACIYTTWAMYLPYYLLTCTSALRLALGQLGAHGWCTWQIAALVSSLLALPMQMRNLHLIAYLGALSSAATLLAVALVVASLLNRGPTPGVTHSLWPDLAAAHGGGVHVADAALRLYGAFGTIIFAYQGQSIFLEIMREMRDARRFGAAVAAANTLMFAVYTFVTVAAYAVDGRHVADFLPSSMPAGPAKSTVSILLAFTSAVSYVITGQPLHRRIHLAVSPTTADARGAKSALRWAAISASTLAGAFVTAVAIPFFGDFQALLGALTGAPIMFGWPALFYLRGCALKKASPARTDRCVCYLHIYLFLPLFTLLGTASAMRDIVHDWREEGSPLECDAS